MSNQPCQHCIRGLTIGRNEVCEPCVGTGFVQEAISTPKVETVVQKIKKEVKKQVKKVLKKTK